MGKSSISRSNQDNPNGIAGLLEEFGPPDELTLSVDVA